MREISEINYKDILYKLEHLTEEEKQSLRKRTREIIEKQKEMEEQQKIEKIKWWNSVKDIPFI